MNTSIVLAEQMNLSELINKAILDYYTRRNLNVPEFANKMQVFRHDFFHRQHLGTKETVEFFGKTTTNGNYQGNWTKSTLSDKEMYVVAAIRFREASGVVGADSSDLDFGTPTVNQVLNATFNFELNGVKQFQDQPISGINQFSEAPDTIWLPRLELVENSNDLKAILSLSEAAGDNWAEFQVIGFRLSPRS